MYIYKLEDRYDSKTGKKLGSNSVQAGVICDFTGEFFEYPEDAGVEFVLEYNSLDACCGCGEGEFEFSQKYKIDIHNFLLGSPYIFSDKEDEKGKTVMERMLTTAKKEKFNTMFFEQLFRWCRIRTADKLLTEGKYTLAELGMQSGEDY